MENKIMLTDLLHLCAEFQRDPSQEHEDAIKSLLANLVIIPYLPIYKKQVAIAMILNCATFTKTLEEQNQEMYDVSEITINMEAGKLIFGILAYAINLENDLGNQALDFGIYDTLYQFGVVDHILQYCQEDYRRLCDMVTEASNFSNIQQLTGTISLMNPDVMNKFSELMGSLKTELTDERLDKLKSLVSASDPSWQALKETIADEAAGKVMKSTLAKFPNESVPTGGKDEK